MWVKAWGNERAHVSMEQWASSPVWLKHISCAQGKLLPFPQQDLESWDKELGLYPEVTGDQWTVFEQRNGIVRSSRKITLAAIWRLWGSREGETYRPPTTEMVIDRGCCTRCWHRGPPSPGMLPADDSAGEGY